MNQINENQSVLSASLSFCLSSVQFLCLSPRKRNDPCRLVFLEFFCPSASPVVFTKCLWLPTEDKPKAINPWLNLVYHCTTKGMPREDPWFAVRDFQIDDKNSKTTRRKQKSKEKFQFLIFFFLSVISQKLCQRFRTCCSSMAPEETPQSSLSY